MRFLCLHGVGSNDEVLEWQTAPLRSKLGGNHEFEFICGSHPFPQAAEIRDIFPEDQGYWAYTNPYEPETVIGFLEDMKAFIQSEGPFDGILGFSQGAELASTFLLMQQQDITYRDCNPFRLAIFFCGLTPWHVDGEKVAKIQPGTTGPTIPIPTVHILGSKDGFYKESLDLANLCNAQHREIFDHGGMHDIPRGSKITSDMATVITKTIERSLLVQ